MLINPYQDQTFVSFIATFFSRLFLMMTGQVSQLATDEIQVFVLAGIALSSAIVGTFLVLRRMTMLANSLSHTILMGIVMAFLLTRGTHDDSHSFIAPMQAMLIASLLMGFLTAFLTEFLTRTARLQEDASTGLVFTSLFALGIILVTVLTKDAHIGTEAVMGNADALHVDDIKWIYAILFFNIVICWAFFKEFKITTFDPALAAALGYSNAFFNYLLMAQVSATSIGAFRAVGVLLVLAFLTGPVLTARLLTHDLKKLLLLSMTIGAVTALMGVALSRHILTVYGVALSTSGVVVCMIAIVYVLALLFAPERGLVSKWIRHSN